MKKLEVIGTKYGDLEIISEHSTTRNGHIRYTCKCVCGKECNILLTHLRQGHTKHCGCKTKKYIGKIHYQFTGYEEISGGWWNSHVVRSASGDKGSRKPLEMTITIEYMWDLFLKQERKCALSGLELTFPRVNKDKNYTASVDRIDSSKGYVEGNVQWVHKMVNFMKNKYNNEVFIEMCKKIANFRKDC